MDVRRPGRADVALALATVGTLAGLGVALRPEQPPPARAATSAADTPRPELTPPRSRPTALVISDSYTSGSGLAETSYACDAVRKMGWLCKLAAEPGTGFISGGNANRFPIDKGTGKSTSFGERISALARSYTPDIVILDGGRNDVFAPPSARFEVTGSTILQIRQTWPKARIVFVAPRFLTRPEDDLGVNDDTVDALKKKADVKDLVVVDPILSFKDSDTKRLISADGTNPNRTGELALAAALADALAKSGIPPAT